MTVNASGRGVQDTSAAEWSAGALVQQFWTKEDVTDITGAINNIEDGTTNLASVTTAGDVTVGTDGGGDMITGSGNTELAVFNTIATTVNAFGAATALNIGDASGTTTFAGDVDVDGDITSIHAGNNILRVESTDGHALVKIDSHTNYDARVDFLESGSSMFRLQWDGGAEKFLFFADAFNKTTAAITESTGDWEFNYNVELSAGDLIITAPSSPASSSTGTIGTIAWDEDFIYVCTATGAPGTWKRAALTGGY